MSPSNLQHYRLRVRNAANDGDELVLSSKLGEGHAFIVEPPSGDGQQLDVLTGRIQDGMYTVLAKDAPAGSLGGIISAAGVVTLKMADADGRYMLLGRRAFVERSTDGGAWIVLVAGSVEGIQLVDAITYEFRIGDTLRIERTRQVFGTVTDAFDRATSFIGGPVRGGWGRNLVTDYGGWQMRVTGAGGDVVTLAFERGALPAPVNADGSLRVSTMIDRPETYHYINTEIGLAYAVDSSSGWRFPEITARLEPLAGGAAKLLTPLASGIRSDTHWPLILTSTPDGAEIAVEWPVAVVGALPSVGDKFNVWMTPKVISEENPLHIFMHPVDIVTALYGEAGITYDAASATSVRNAIGPDVRALLRITESYTLADFAAILFGVFGFSFRAGAAGERVFFLTRKRGASVPVTTVVLSDLLSDDPVIFDLDEGSIADLVTMRQRSFRRWTSEYDDVRPSDGVLSFQESLTVELVGGSGAHEVVYELPGTIQTEHSGTGKISTANFDAFVQGVAKEILIRFGRGCPAGGLVVREAVAALLGDEFVLDVAHQINGSTRGGQRVLQVIRRTPQPDGSVELKFLDAGLTAQASTVPTLSLASTSKATATVTITNAATLDAAGLTVRLEWGFGSSSPTDGGLLSVIDPGDVSVLALPRVDSGTRVWVRARSEREDRRPSAWSAWADVDLTDLSPPTGLSRSGNVYTFTPGESDRPLRVRLTHGGRTDVVAILPNGSAQIDLTPFVPPGTSVTVGLAHIDDEPYKGVSTEATDTYTTAAATALPTPVAPVGFVGLVENGERFAGVFGMEATALSFPSSMEFEEAVETAVGAGTYGSFVTVGTVPSVVGGPTRIERTAPADRMRRQLRARLVAPSRTPSGYAGPVTLLPWSTSIRAPARRGSLPLVNDLGAADGFAAKAENADGTLLPAATVQTDGVAVRSLLKGQTGVDARDGDAVDFTENFQNIPLVLFRGDGVTHQPESKWGTAAEVDADDGSANDAPANAAEHAVFAAEGLSVSGVDKIVARLRQDGTPTARTHEFTPASNDLDTEGETTDWIVLSNAPSLDDKYKVHFSVALEVQASGEFGSGATLQVVVAVETRTDGGSPIERGTLMFQVFDPKGGGSTSYSNPHAEIEHALAGVDNTDEVRLKLKTITLTGIDATIHNIAVHAFDGTGDPSAGITYTTDSGVKFTSKTPGANDRVHVDFIASQ